MAKNKRFYAKLAVVMALALFVAAQGVFAYSTSYSNSSSHSTSSDSHDQYQSQKTDVAVYNDADNKVDVHQNVDVYAKAEVNDNHSGCDHDCGCDHGCRNHDRVIRIYHKEIIIKRLPVTGSNMLVLGGILVAAALVAFGAVKVIKRA